ncbi:hypothetical protein, partial [Streptomyces chartreusis]
ATSRSALPDTVNSQQKTTIDGIRPFRNDNYSCSRSVAASIATYKPTRSAPRHVRQQRSSRTGAPHSSPVARDTIGSPPGVCAR